MLVELPIGHYHLEVQAKGFQKYLQQGISLDVNQTATVGIHLKLGSETQQVEVSADAALVQSTVSSLGQTVMEREILDLPAGRPQFFSAGTASARRCAFDPWTARSWRSGTAESGLCRGRPTAGVEQFHD